MALSAIMLFYSFHRVHLQNVLSTQTETLYPSLSAHGPSLQAVATAIILSVSMNLTTLVNLIYTESYSTRPCRVAYFTEDDVSGVHRCSVSQNPFLKANNISLHAYTTFCLPTHPPFFITF